MNQENKTPQKKTVSKTKKAKKPVVETFATAQPLMVYETSAAVSQRRNTSSIIERTDRYKNIEDGIIPFKGITKLGSQSNISVRDTVELCQKAYYNFAVFRNTIDVMTEFSISEIYFKEGTQKAREFFKALFRRINIWDLQDKFFREYYRSGNVFIQRFETKVQQEEVKKITQVFGKDNQIIKAAESYNLPIRYIILNPSDIYLAGSINFASPNYYKILNNYEIQRLKNPTTDEEKEFFKSLPKDLRDSITKKSTTSSELAYFLDPQNVVAVFYKKQDYEPFAIPMGFPVLEDINFKQELKKMDMAAARTMQQIVLLVTTGAKKSEGGVNPANIKAIQQLFENESIGRVLVADYTTNIKFAIPDISSFMDPKKYEIFDRDINIGLNNIFTGGEKFANQSSKIDVFISRLMQAREAFINNFLFPEIKRISKQLGFKNYPVPVFEDVSLKDNSILAKIYTRLGELGILTPEEVLKAIETGTLPDQESSLSSQEKFKQLKDQGYFNPIIGGAKSSEAGRPEGTMAPKETDSVSPMGSGASTKKFSLSKLKDNLILANSLEAEVSKFYKKQVNKKRLSKSDKSAIESLSRVIILNENPENWISSIAKYFENPTLQNEEKLQIIDSIASEHDLDLYTSSLLSVSIYQDQ